VLPLPEGHTFPMSKYARLHERVLAVAPALGITLHEPPAASDAALARAHDADYVRAMADGSADPALMRRIGFPWSPAMVERSRRSSGGTMMALQVALQGDGIAVNLAGGTHHAGPARGGGYCVFNDAAVAARHVQALGLARRVLVVDLDVHQGDGTALIAAGDESLFTFSMHSARNYPAIQAGLRPRRAAARRHRRRRLPGRARPATCRRRSSARAPTPWFTSPAPTPSSATAWATWP